MGNGEKMGNGDDSQKNLDPFFEESNEGAQRESEWLNALDNMDHDELLDSTKKETRRVGNAVKEVKREEMFAAIVKKRIRTEEVRAADANKVRALDPNDEAVQDEALRAIVKLDGMSEFARFFISLKTAREKQYALDRAQSLS